MADKKVPISVIILTHNEEKNIEECLKSVYSWTEEIFILDSFSSDKTLEIAKKYTDKIYQHTFESYGHQRNWAQKNLPIIHEWVFHLDADERVSPELWNEIYKIFSKGVSSNINGFLIKKKIIFLQRQIKYGGCSNSYHLRLFRKNKGQCETRKYDQHFMCERKVKKLKYHIIDENKIDISEWIARHNYWSGKEAEEIAFRKTEAGRIKGKFFGSPIEKKRWLRDQIYYKLPLFIRSLIYFFYRYFFRLGFLDGKEGIIYHFLQGFWFRFLVDTKIYEKIKTRKE